MGRPALSLAGMVFSKLTVTERSGSDERGRSMWLCRCECGNTIVLSGSHIKSGFNVSCGCTRYTYGKPVRTHRNHQSWRSMMKRCYYVKDISFKNYGGRGITVCDEWHNPLNFFRDMESSYFPGATLDRIDVNGNYFPENCRWATIDQQANNKRTNLRVSALGETLTVSQWAKKTGMSKQTIRERVVSGWPHELAVTVTPDSANCIEKIKEHSCFWH